MSVPLGRLTPMSLTADLELVRCSPTEGCGQLKPRYQRARRLNQDPAEIRRSNLWAKYRITPEQYDALRAGQNYRCGICGIDEADVDLKRVGGRPRRDGQPLFKVPLAVDHDHRTGVIRGLLCPSCNAGLGAFSDDPDRLCAAITHLESAPPLGREPDVGLCVQGADGAESAFQESIADDLAS
jgi:hypothetical protein